MRFDFRAVIWEATRTLKMHAPVRDYRVYSPYGAPGNLKNQGINNVITRKTGRIVIGGAPAPYAIYTETRSRRKYWIKKSEHRIERNIERYENVRRK